MSWCCAAWPRCHILYSVARVLCILTEWLWTASAHRQTSGQACCSVQIGDSFCFRTVMPLSPAGPLYHKYPTMSFASGLLGMSTVVLHFIFLSSGPDRLLHLHTLDTLLTHQSLSVCLLLCPLLSVSPWGYCNHLRWDSRFSSLSPSVDWAGQMNTMPWLQRASICLRELWKLMTYCMCGSYLSY